MSATITESIAIIFLAVLLYLGYVAVRCRVRHPAIAEDGSPIDT